jgi:hypothetical protein
MLDPAAGVSTFYINGNEVAEMSTTFNAVRDLGGSFYIGAYNRHTEAQNFAGEIAEVR